MIMTIDDMVTAWTAANRREQQLQDQVTDLQKQLAATGRHNLAAMVQDRDMKLALVEGQVAKQKQWLRDSAARWRALQKELAYLKGQLKQGQKPAATVSRTDYDALKAELERCRERLASVQSVIDGNWDNPTLQRKRAEAAELEVTALRGELDRCLAGLEMTRSDWASCRRVCQEWREAVQKHAERATQLQVERDQLRKDNVGLADRLERSAADRDDLAQCCASLSKSEESVADLVRSSESLQARLDAAAARNKHLDEECSQLRSAHAESRREVDRLARVVAALSRCREAAWKAVATLPVASIQHMADACRKSSTACFCGAHSTPIGGGIEDGPASLPVPIKYRNHRGEVAIRKILPLGVFFGATEWHPQPQWLLDAFDVDKQAGRSFAMRDILAWGEHAVAASPDGNPATAACHQAIRSLAVLHERLTRDILQCQTVAEQGRLYEIGGWLIKLSDGLTRAVAGSGATTTAPESAQAPVDTADWAIVRVRPDGSFVTHWALGRVGLDRARSDLALCRSLYRETPQCRFAMAWRPADVPRRLYEMDMAENPGDNDDVTIS